MVLGREASAKKVFLIDFGLARRYLDREGGAHI
jgi:hypothetical protein